MLVLNPSQSDYLVYVNDDNVIIPSSVVSRPGKKLGNSFWASATRLLSRFTTSARESEGGWMKTHVQCATVIEFKMYRWILLTRLISVTERAFFSVLPTITKIASHNLLSWWCSIAGCCMCNRFWPHPFVTNTYSSLYKYKRNLEYKGYFVLFWTQRFKV